MAHELQGYAPGTYVFDVGEMDSDYACSAYNTGVIVMRGLAMPIKGLFCEVEYEYEKSLPKTEDGTVDYAAIVRRLDRSFEDAWKASGWQLESPPLTNVIVGRKDCRLRQHHDDYKGSPRGNGIRTEFFSTIIVGMDGAESTTETIPAVTDKASAAERKLLIASLADFWPPYSLPLDEALEVKVIESFRGGNFPAATVAISGLEHVLQNFQVADIENWL